MQVVLGLVVGALELIAHGGPPSLSLTQSAIDVESKMVALERQRDIFLSSITDTHLMALCGPSSDGTVLPELGRAGTWRGSRPRREQGVTLVTQLSLNRLSMLHRQCDAWTDVIAAALYVPVAAGLIVAPEDAEMHGRPVEAAVQRVAAFHAELEQAGERVCIRLLGEVAGEGRGMKQPRWGNLHVLAGSGPGTGGCWGGGERLTQPRARWFNCSACCPAPENSTPPRGATRQHDACLDIGETWDDARRLDQTRAPARAWPDHLP